MVRATTQAHPAQQLGIMVTSTFVRPFPAVSDRRPPQRRSDTGGLHRQRPGPLHPGVLQLLHRVLVAGDARA